MSLNWRRRSGKDSQPLAPAGGRPVPPLSERNGQNQGGHFFPKGCYFSLNLGIPLESHLFPAASQKPCHPGRVFSPLSPTVFWRTPPDSPRVFTSLFKELKPVVSLNKSTAPLSPPFPKVSLVQSFVRFKRHTEGTCGRRSAGQPALLPGGSRWRE